MEEKYFINDSKIAYTWKQLLYWCYQNIANLTWSYNPHGKYGIYPSTGRNGKILTGKDQKEIEFFFNKFKHNPNDGIRRKGFWKQNYHYELVQGKDDNGRLTSEWTKKLFFDDWVWIESKFTPKEYQVKDSYGRIIPSEVIRSSYLNYIPSILDRKNPDRKSYFSLCNHGYEFRKDPVPGRGRYRNGHWHRINGNKAGRAAMKRQWYRDNIYSREVFEEYHVTFRMDRKEYYSNHHNSSTGRGWKRSKKEKQWMKFGWKKLYEVPYE